MLGDMTWDQFNEWKEYARIEPFGEEREDLRMGQICATLVNVNRASSESPWATPSDFMFDFEQAADQADDRSKPKTASQPLTDHKEWANWMKMFKAMADPAAAEAEFRQEMH